MYKYKRENSIFNVIDATPGQYYRPLQLWELAAVELWTENDKENNEYKKHEVFYYLNFFPIDEFKAKFFNEFEIYKKQYTNATVETFKVKYYKQFILDCGDMIEMFEKENYYYWTTKRGFDFYLKEKSNHSEKAMIFEKSDYHNHELNIKALLQFFEVDCMIETKSEGESKNIKTTKQNYVWFKVGIELAQGHLDKYFIVKEKKIIAIASDYNPLKIAKELKNEKYSQVIKCTLTPILEGENARKNILINKKQMLYLYEYCKSNQFKMTDFFIEKYNQLPQD